MRKNKINKTHINADGKDSHKVNGCKEKNGINSSFLKKKKKKIKIFFFLNYQ